MRISSNRFGGLSKFIDLNMRWIFIIAIIALTTDSVISNIADFITPAITSVGGIILFVSLICLNLAIQALMLHYVKRKFDEIATRVVYLRKIHFVVTGVQIFLLFISIAILFQILIFSKFNTIFLILVTGTTYLSAGFFLILLFVKFFAWLRINRNIVVLFYTMASMALVFMSISSAIEMNYILASKPLEIDAETPVVYPEFDDGTLEKTLSDYYVLADILSFSLIWISTALVLKHYSKKFGSVKFWIIITLPLIYFASNFFDLIPGLEFFDDFSLIIITTLNSSLGGILFGIVFLTASRKIPSSNVVRSYLTIAAYGFVLWFTCNQASVISASYPPFGLVAVSNMGLAAYIILVGLYCCAVSISLDSGVRKEVRKSTEREYAFLDKIGLSQMYDNIKKSIVTVESKNLDKLVDMSGVQSSLTPENMRDYVSEVLKELQRKKNKAEDSAYK